MKERTILYIDIGDDITSTKKNVSRLKEAGYHVTLLNLQEAAQQYVPEKGFAAGNSINEEIKERYDEIILAAHGHKGDVKHCYTLMGETKVTKKGEVLFDYAGLAEFANALFSKLKITSFDQLVLLICYSARTEELNNYATHPLESFAYQFFYEFCNKGKFKEVSMTAPIAEIRIGDNGSLEVATEEYQDFIAEQSALTMQISELQKTKKESIESQEEIDQKIEALRESLAEKDKYSPVEALENYGQVQYHADVNHHHCSIYIEKQPEKPSLFSFFLPKSDKLSLYEGDLVTNAPDDDYRKSCTTM